MEAAVRMRAAGWSLRQIAGDLKVDEKTIRNDLARWEQRSVDQLLRTLGAESYSSDARNSAPNSAPEESP